MYIYPDNLKAKTMLWLWELRDIGILGIGLIVSAFGAAETGTFIPLMATATYGFLSIRVDDSSVLDFLRYAAMFLILKQQYFEWRARYEK